MFANGGRCSSALLRRLLPTQAWAAPRSIVSQAPLDPGPSVFRGLSQDAGFQGLSDLAGRPAILPGSGGGAAGAHLRLSASKAMRDPARPERPPTPWVRFLADFRKRSDVKGKTVMSVASQEWKGLSAEHRRPFEEPYEKEKQQYIVKFQEYESSGKKEAWKRDPEKPKKPLTGYMLFLQDFRASNKHLKVTEVATLGAEAWKALPAGEKAPYDVRYAAEKTTYDKAFKAYKESGKEEAWKKKKGLLGVKENAQLLSRVEATKLRLAKAKENLKDTKEALKQVKAAAKVKKTVATKAATAAAKTKAAATAKSSAKAATLEATVKVTKAAAAGGAAKPAKKAAAEKAAETEKVPAKRAAKEA